MDEIDDFMEDDDAPDYSDFPEPVGSVDSDTDWFWGFSDYD